MSIAVVLITVDRESMPIPGRNYLEQTLLNLSRAGVFRSPLVDSFTLVDSGSPSLLHIHRALTSVDCGRRINVDAMGKRSPTANAARALDLGSRSGSPYVLFLEDDIDVIDGFVESVGMWMDKHFDTRVWALGANYNWIDAAVVCGEEACRYPLEQFYGTLGFVVRAVDAARIAAHWRRTPDRQEYDLMIAEWAREQGATHFLTPAPSFVQHIGDQSTLRPGDVFHQYSSWPGPQWTYQPRERV